MNVSTRMDGRPSFQFYPGDWLEDSELKMCSLAARGLWIYALCIMWNSPERGTLRTGNGKPITAAGLAGIVGASETETQRCIDELKAQSVCSVADDGAILCRRMYRLWAVSRSRRNAGQRGGKAKREKGE